MDAYEYSIYPSYETLKTWNQLNCKTYDIDKSDIPKIQFKKDCDINKKIILWSGDIEKLQVQSIVISINQFLQSKHSVDYNKLSRFGGNKYTQQFISKVNGCKTGEIRITEAFDLPCNYIIHTVSPKFNAQYESAAVNALYNCYRNALMTALEKGLTSIAFETLHISKYEFPHDIAIHLTARIFRRFLEQHGRKFDAIIINIPLTLKKKFEDIFAIYFPRNEDEEIYSAINTPSDLGNENGQPMQAERSIRISAFPYGPTRRADSSDDEEEIDTEVEESRYRIESTSNDNEHLSDITASGCHKLTQTQVAPALLRQSISIRPTLPTNDAMARSLKNYEQSLSIERRFDRLFRQSKQMDFKNWTDLKVFYLCGKDVNEHPIYLVLEKNIPDQLEEHKNDAISFIIWMLEKHVSKGKYFSIVYAHTESENRPSRAFFREVCQLLNPRYFKQLRYICMVHGSFIQKTMNWMLTTFNLPELKPKLINVFNLRQLYRIIDPILLELPDFVYEHDKHVGGANSYNENNIMTQSMASSATQTFRVTNHYNL